MLATQKEESAYEAAQRRSPVVYSCAVGAIRDSEDSIVVKESRNLLSAGGTTGLRTWDAALHLGTYLLREGSGIVRNKRVLELGAGTGFLSILCAGPLRASKVVSTDGTAQVVKLIELNIEANQDALGLQVRGISPYELRWGKAATQAIYEKEFPAGEPCDLVIAADVVDATLPGPSHQPQLTRSDIFSRRYGRSDCVRRRSSGREPFSRHHLRFETTRRKYFRNLPSSLWFVI